MSTAPDTIRSYVISSERPGPSVLITAGVHGDEYEPMLVCLELIKHLPAILTRGSVTVVPVVNYSAFLAGSRTGADGLDLARICPGNPDGTPSEAAASGISSYIAAADYFIDLHTGGRLLDIYPLAGYMLHASTIIRKRQQEMGRAFNLPLIWGTDDRLNGRTLSVARDAGVPAIYVEYGGGGLIRNEIIEAYIQGCINVLSYLEMTDPVKAVQPGLKYIVEDDTPDAGYLQRKMPAPAEGIFVPGLKTGEPVKKGQEWGIITAMPDGKQYSIYADSDGIVLFLRVPGFVRPGDTLGGILNVGNYHKTATI